MAEAYVANSKSEEIMTAFHIHAKVAVLIAGTLLLSLFIWLAAKAVITANYEKAVDSIPVFDIHELPPEYAAIVEADRQEREGLSGFNETLSESEPDA